MRTADRRPSNPPLVLVPPQKAPHLEYLGNRRSSHLTMRLTVVLVAAQFLSACGVGSSDQSASNGNELCDWEAYLSRYPDLTAHGNLTEAQAKMHFETIGKAQGRQCTKDFQLNGLEQFKLRNSSCSHAINFEQAFSLQKQKMQNASPRMMSSKLKAVDIGAGTTGTRFLFGVVCGSLNLRGYHWTARCSQPNGPTHLAGNPLASWWIFLIGCIRNAPHETESSGCESDVAVEKLDRELKKVLDEVDILMDSPMDAIYAHYAPYMSDALTFMTIRDPMEWAVKRHKEHPVEPLMCKPEIYALGHAYHPYDIISCLKSTKFVHQAIMTEKDTSRSAEGYVAMNTYNAAMASHLHIMCLWDAPPEEAGPEVLAAWEQFSNSS